MAIETSAPATAEVSPGKVVGICRERGTDVNGVAVDRRFGGLWVIEGGKIVSWSTYLTPKEAVRAARELGVSGRFVPERGPAQKPAKQQKQRAAKARAKVKREAARS